MYKKTGEFWANYKGSKLPDYGRQPGKSTVSNPLPRHELAFCNGCGRWKPKKTFEVHYGACLYGIPESRGVADIAGQMLAGAIAGSVVEALPTLPPEPSQSQPAKPAKKRRRKRKAKKTHAGN